MTCKLCSRLPASIDALCPDCFWLTEIKPRLELRQNLLDSMSQNETSLKAALERVAPVGRLADGTYRSILHRCICGHVEETWLALHMHLVASGPGHGYVLREAPTISTDETLYRCICGHKEASHEETETCYPCKVCACMDFELGHTDIIHGEPIGPKPKHRAPACGAVDINSWLDAAEGELE